MNVDQLASEAMKLEPELRARLAERIYLSLDAFSPEESSAIWADEAQRRSSEMDSNPSLGIPAEDVFARSYAKLK